jgi:cytochrome c5
MTQADRARAQEDTRFWNHFMMVTIALHAIIVGFFVLARSVGATQDEARAVEPTVQEAVGDRIRPPVRVAVAGETPPEEPAETAAAAQPPPAAAATTQLDGKQVFDTACSACHAAGIAGAPRFGDAAAWRPRIAQGKEVLYRHSLEGFQGQAGFMPPKGGRPDLSEDSVRAGVDYMVGAANGK